MNMNIHSLRCLFIAFPILAMLCGHRQAGHSLLQWYHVEGQGQQRVVESYVHIDHDPKNSSYAVCITGYRGEAILYDKMFRHYRDFVFTPDTDLFLFIETSNRIVSHNGTLGTDFDLSRLKELYGPWLRSFVVTNGHDLREEEGFLDAHGQRAATAVHGWNTILRNLHKQTKCNTNLLQPYELKRGKPFDAVLKTRPEFYLNRTQVYRPVIGQRGPKLPVHCCVVFSV